MAHPLHIAFIWHMHQPYYRDLASGACSMPWVRLHATKDYLDMVLRLSEFPAIHQTFNLVPSLLDQLEEYLPPKNQSDVFLDLSRKPAEELSADEQRFILEWFFLANPERMIKPYHRYHDLLVKRGAHVREGQWPEVLKRFKPQDLRDIQVWFNLVWIDPWFRRKNPSLAALETKGGRFTEEEKALVLQAQLQIISQIIPAYRKMAESGQIELSTSPYYHPIMPLLCDSNAARMSIPDAGLPKTAFRHPEDAGWQLKMAMDRHAQAFGGPPQGIWPSEGGVSEEFVKIAIGAGIRWTATDEIILWRSLKMQRRPDWLYRPHRIQRAGGELSVVFRDRELSDAIGFVYSQWDADSAVADFLQRLSVIHQQAGLGSQPALATIILDGENAWEFYYGDGHEFLTKLYQALSVDQRFRCVTVSEFLNQFPDARGESIAELFSGSWIDGNFATWIGHPEKNDAWDCLADLRSALADKDRQAPANRQAWKSLGAAEGSDWMWWFGDTHFTAQADEFDRLFRRHVASAYQLAGLAVPDALAKPIRRKVFSPLYEPTGPVELVVDGRETSYYEWLYAGRIDLRSQYSAIHRGSQYLQGLLYGLNRESLCLRLDVDSQLRTQLSEWAIVLRISGGDAVVISYKEGQINAVFQQQRCAVECAFDRIIEAALPLKQVQGIAGGGCQLAIELTKAGEILERHPSEGSFAMPASADELAQRAWPL